MTLSRQLVDNNFSITFMSHRPSCLSLCKVCQSFIEDFVCSLFIDAVEVEFSNMKRKGEN